MGVLMLRLLIFRGTNDVWIAQCLEHDIAVEGKTLRQVMACFAEAIFAHVVIAEEHACDPITSIPPPPPEYQERWSKAVKLADVLPIPAWTDRGRAEAEVRIAA